MAMLDCADFEMCPKKAHFGHAGQGAEITIHPMNPYNKRIRWFCTLWEKTDHRLCIARQWPVRNSVNSALAGGT